MNACRSYVDAGGFRRGVAMAGLVALICAASNPFAAQNYPDKPVRFIVPYAPGGGTDNLARLISSRVSEGLKQQVVIDNRAGAASNIGNQMAAHAAPDGYTLLMGATAFVANVSLYSNPGYDPIRDFAPVTLLAISPNIVVVHPSLPARSLQELIAYAKSNPGVLNYASGGRGTTPHLAAELMKSMAGLDIVHVPFKSAGPAVIALLAGEVKLSLLPTMTVMPHVASGRLRALAITTAKRSPAFPELPTAAESGLPGFDANQWYGVLVPRGATRAVIGRLHKEFTGALSAQEVRASLTREGSIPIGNEAAEFAAFLAADLAKWAKAVLAAGAKAD